MYLRKPYNEEFKITSPFGERIHPVTGKKKYHKGVDLGMPIGTELIAPFNGKVTKHINRGGLTKGYGLYCYLEGSPQDRKVRLLFAHLSDVIADGDVKAGQVIAKSGNTGTSTGAHLHLQLEVWTEAGRLYVPVNPESTINFRSERA